MQKSEIKNKIFTALDNSDFDAFIVTGYDNIHYLTGAELPFAPYRNDQYLFFVYQKGGEAALVCPSEWVKTAIYTGWVRQVIGYNASSACMQDALAKVKALVSGTGKVGIDLSYTKSDVYEALKAALPNAEFHHCDCLLRDLREVKCDTEKKLLENIAMLVDHGLNGAIHHVTVDRRTSALTLAEEFRVHTLERGADIVGYNGSTTVLTGQGNDHYHTHTGHYGYAETVDLLPAQMVRMVVPASKDGYWADSVRIMTMGDMYEDQEQAYGWLVALREAALAAVKPGNTAADVYKAMSDCAKKNNIPLQDQCDLGHGIGSALYEAPYINPCDQTTLKKDMVLVIAPVVKAENGLLWIQKDTVEVTEDGCKIIGWYKDWREPYIPIASI